MPPDASAGALVIAALQSQIETYFSDEEAWDLAVPEIQYDADTPVEVPAAGLIIIRDGDAGEPVQSLGDGFPVYYSHAVEIEIYFQSADAEERADGYAGLVQGVGAALNGDRTLGGACIGMVYGAPAGTTQAVEGAAGIKAGIMRPLIDYQSETSF